MEDFLKQTNQRYNMDVVQATGDIKSALGKSFSRLRIPIPTQNVELSSIVVVKTLLRF